MARQRALYYAVADVYDALTSSRPYRSGMSPGETLAFMDEKEGLGLDRDALEKLSGLVRNGTQQA